MKRFWDAIGLAGLVAIAFAAGGLSAAHFQHERDMATPGVIVPLVPSDTYGCTPPPHLTERQKHFGIVLKDCAQAIPMTEQSIPPCQPDSRHLCMEGDTHPAVQVNMQDRVKVVPCENEEQGSAPVYGYCVDPNAKEAKP